MGIDHLPVLLDTCWYVATCIATLMCLYGALVAGSSGATVVLLSGLVQSPYPPKLYLPLLGPYRCVAPG
jgi:hypothetical protein